MEVLLKLLMDKLKSNRGNSMIEMIFVLMILSLLTTLSLSHFPNLSRKQMEIIKERLQKAQYASIQNHEKIYVSFRDKTMTVGENFYHLDPLSCEDLSFHYNSHGNISHADTLICAFRNNRYAFRLQLGSGWIRE